jgi:hypothetical protein
MRIDYVIGNERLYDRQRMRRILDVNRSKLQRELGKFSEMEVIEHKNLHLYRESTLLQLMEVRLFELIERN